MRILERRPLCRPASPPSPSVSLSLSLVLLGTFGGCATLHGKGGRGSSKAPLAGVWEGVFKGTLGEGGTGSGDTRIERQAWRLAQTGDSITGFYVVELTMISGDGRPYLCSREPRFSTLLRFDVRGRVARDGIEIDEVGEVWAKGACRPTYHMPAHF